VAGKKHRAWRCDFCPAPKAGAGADGASLLPIIIGVVAAMDATIREPAEILLVDEDPIALASAVTALDSAGHVVYQAPDRISALRIARAEALDLVICDVSVGGECGLELS